MKIYISADIEGISGVVNTTHTSQKSYDYDRARKLMTDEVNAAVRGAKLAGAKEILVNDSHGPMTNILIEELDEDVKLISGSQKYLGMMEGIDETFDGVLLIGYHARHNTPGVLAHSYHSSLISEIKVNGDVVGEYELNSLVAGYYGVPVALVAGDNVLADQVKEFNADTETVIVKYAHSRYTAQCLQPKRVHRMLEDNVHKALGNKLESIKLRKIEGKIQLEVAFMHSGMAEAILFMPGTEMISPNRVGYMAKNIIEAYKVRAAFTMLAANVL